MKTRVFLRWILPSSILAFVLGAVLLGSASVSSQRKPAKDASPTPVQTKPGIGPQKDPSAVPFENFDIRVRVPKTSRGNEADAADSGQLKLEVSKPKVSEKNVDDSEIRKSMLSAQRKLEKSVPNL